MIERSDYSLWIDKIDSLIQLRVKTFPLRDEHYRNLMEGINDFIRYLIKNTDFNNFVPNDELLSKSNSWLQNPVFICGGMRSGTTLIGKLLDGHSQLVVIPADSGYARDFIQHQNISFEDLAVYWLRRFITPTGQEPFWFFGKERQTLQIFLQYLYYCYVVLKMENFISLVIAVYIASGQYQKPIKHWVEKTPRNEDYVAFLLEKFPNAKFIHSLRNPLAIMASVKRMERIRYHSDTDIQAFSIQIKTGFGLAQLYKNQLGDLRYFVYRYEDLVSYPQEKLEQICNFLGIPFEEILYIPTENGRTATSNSMYSGERVRGKILNLSNDTRYLNELTNSEMDVILNTLRPEMEQCGYDFKDLK